jgi:hypothetical protein
MKQVIKFSSRRIFDIIKPGKFPGQFINIEKLTSMEWSYCAEFKKGLKLTIPRNLRGMLK